MELRAAIPAELAQLNHIALQAKAHWGYAPEQLAKWRPNLDTKPGTVEAWPTFVAQNDLMVVGFAQIDPTAVPWELVSLWVLPVNMGQGIGKALLRRCLQAAATSGQACIHVDSDPNALGFYLACGAEVISTVAAPIPGQPNRDRPQLRIAANAA